MRVRLLAVFFCYMAALAGCGDGGYTPAPIATTPANVAGYYTFSADANPIPDFLSITQSGSKIGASFICSSHDNGSFSGNIVGNYLTLEGLEAILTGTVANSDITGNYTKGTESGVWAATKLASNPCENTTTAQITATGDGSGSIAVETISIGGLTYNRSHIFNSEDEIFSGSLFDIFGMPHDLFPNMPTSLATVGLQWVEDTWTIDDWPVTLTTRVMSKSVTVVTPAGTFDNCIQVDTVFQYASDPGTGLQYRQRITKFYRENIGIVKIVIERPTQTDTAMLSSYSVAGTGIVPLEINNTWTYQWDTFWFTLSGMTETFTVTDLEVN